MKSLDPEIFKKSFLSRMEAGKLLKLFDYIPGIYFYLKDEKARLVANNQAGVMRKKTGAAEKDVIGKTDFDFFPKEYAQKYYDDDLHVVKTGKSIMDRIEIIPNNDGSIGWFKTTKIPVTDESGKVIGCAGVTQDLGSDSWKGIDNHELQPSLKYISRNIATPISVPELAKTVGMSVSKLERKFKLYYNMTPGKFIAMVKIKTACKSLLSTSKTVSEIAADLGFTNSANFSTLFRKIMDQTPKQYRASHLR